MPSRPKRGCSVARCPNLTDGRFCDEHQKLQNKNYERYGRNPETKKRYKGDWPRIRERYRLAHPYCAVCFSKGIMVETEEVHHKVPLSEGGTHEDTNLVALCSSCHARWHAVHGDRWNKDRQYSY